MWHEFGDESPPNPDGPPQGGTKGSRKEGRKANWKVAERKAARPDLGSALSSARGSRSERVEVFGNRRTVFGMVTSLEPLDQTREWGCPTRSLNGVDGSSQT